MPKLLDPKTGQTYTVESAAGVQEYLAAGYQLVEDSGDVGLQTPGGREVSVSADDLAAYAGSLPGVQSIDPGELVERGRSEFEAQEFEEQYGGVGGDIRALGEGAVSGLTLGGYDVLADWVGLDTEKYAQANPNFRLAGEAAGIVGATVASGGGALGGAGKVLAKTPAGLLSKGSMALGAKVGGTGLKGVVAGQALEGAGYAAAQTTSQILIDDDPLVGEAAVAEVARNALFGAAIGGGTAAVFGGLGKLGNKIVKGLDDSSPLLNLRGKQGKELFNNTSKALNEADLSVQHSVEVAERGLGSTKLTAEEAQHWTKLNADVSAFEVLEKQVNDLAATNIQPPTGVGAFNEGLEAMHADLTQLLGKGYRGTPQGLAFDEAGDKLFAALATGEQGAISAAIPKYVKQAKKIARGLGVDITDDLRGFAEFEAAMKSPPKIGLNDDVQAAFDRFKAAKGTFAEAGGLSPESVQRLVVEATEAGARKSAANMANYVRSAKELADAVGSPASKLADEVLEGLEDSLMGMRIPKNLVDPAVVAGMKTSQTELRAALNVTEGAIKPAHMLDIAALPIAEAAPKLKAVDNFFKQAREFAAATDDKLLVGRLDAIEGAIGDYTKSALNGVKLGRLDKQALGTVLGLELLEYSGFDMGPVDDILQLMALSKLMGRAAKSTVPGGGLTKRILTRAGSRLLPAFGRKAGIVGPGLGGSAVGGGLTAGGYSAGGWLNDALRGQAGAAGLAGKTRASISHMLENAGKSKAPRAGALTTAWLYRSSFEFGDRKQPKMHATDLKGAFKQRSEELLRIAAAPMAAQAVIHEQVRPLRLVSESLADQIEVQSMEIPSWLYEKMPKDPGTIQTLGQSRWQPSEVDILEWAEYGKGALYPMETIEGALSGDISPQAAESLRTLWPEHFYTLQVEILKRAPELAESLSYDQQVRLSILTGVPIDSTMDSPFRRFMLDQEAAQQAEQESTMAKPSQSNNTSSPQADNEFSPAQKLLR